MAELRHQRVEKGASGTLSVTPGSRRKRCRRLPPTPWTMTFLLAEVSMNTDQKTCVQIAFLVYILAGLLFARWVYHTMELTMDDEAAFALIAVMAACGLFLMMLRVL
jgi:hypothetical protein